LQVLFFFSLVPRKLLSASVTAPLALSAWMPLPYFHSFVAAWAKNDCCSTMLHISPAEKWCLVKVVPGQKKVAQKIGSERTKKKN